MTLNTQDRREISLFLNAGFRAHLRVGIAGQTVVTDLADTKLAAFSADAAQLPDKTELIAELTKVARIVVGRAVPSDPIIAWFTDQDRKTTASYWQNNTLVDIAGLGKYLVCPDQVGAISVDPVGKPSGDALLSVALGPLLCLLLAERGIFCLHASAILLNNKAVAVVGESGAGKSTLAAFVADSLTGAERLSDDILPVQLGNGIVARPDFPQLKLPVEEQCETRSVTYPLAAVIEVQRAESGQKPRLEQVLRKTALLMLVRHTVAARIFRPELLQKHLDFCIAVGETIPCYKLHYPHDLGALPLVTDLLHKEMW